VPVNLCAKVPDSVSDDEAAFTVVCAIGLQGIRLAQPTLGERGGGDGPGSVGLMTVQLLRAHGCRVLGLDFDADKLALARQLGRRGGRLGGGRGPGGSGAALFARARRGRGADHGLHQEQRAGAPGRADVPQARAHRAGGRDRAGTVARRLLREGTELPGLVFLRAGALRPERYEDKGTTTRSASCAGPSSAISRRCWT
jgi:hypothetical protein